MKGRLSRLVLGGDANGAFGLGPLTAGAATHGSFASRNPPWSRPEGDRRMTARSSRLFHSHPSTNTRLSNIHMRPTLFFSAFVELRTRQGGSRGQQTTTRAILGAIYKYLFIYSYADADVVISAVGNIASDVADCKTLLRSSPPRSFYLTPLKCTFTVIQFMIGVPCESVQ